MFVPGGRLKPSLMFAIKALAYLSEAPFRYSTLGLATVLTRKHETTQEWPAWDEHPSLL